MIDNDLVSRDAIIRTAWGEARGESREGQAAVVWVILNRASAPAWWGRTSWDVCHHAMQFSCWNFNDPNFPQLVTLQPSSAVYQEIGAIVDGVIRDRARGIPDPTGGATHYKVTGTPASWDKATVGITPVIIGHHSFYKLGAKA